MAQAEIGLIGLAVMGSNLALNIAEKGYPHRGFQPHHRTHRQFHAECRRAARPIDALHDHGRVHRRHPPAAAGDHHGEGRRAGR